MKLKLLLLIAIILALNAASLRAQDENPEMPFIVDPPKVSVTEFTNWTKMKIVFTVRYLEGYEPELDLADPHQMSFGFELDPQDGQRLIVENERKLRRENYKDLVYYVRLIQEKKGDIIIPEQKFWYVSILPGKPRENLEAKEFKTQPLTVKYDSVLPSNADDIKDEIDFGSFKTKADTFKAVAASGFLLTWFVMLFLVFRNPMTEKTKARNAKKAAGEKSKTVYVLSPKAAIKVFTAKLNWLGAGGTLASLDNSLREFLMNFSPILVNSDTLEEMEAKIAKMQAGRQRELLMSLLSRWKAYEDHLYGKTEFEVDMKSEIASVWKMADELKGYRMFLAELQNSKGCVAKTKYLWRTVAVRR